MNSTVKNNINIPVTAQLRTACRSSLMTMGFSSHSRQLVKWDLSLAKAAVIKWKIAHCPLPIADLKSVDNLVLIGNRQSKIGNSLHASLGDGHKNVLQVRLRLAEFDDLVFFGNQSTKNLARGGLVAVQVKMDFVRHVARVFDERRLQKFLQQLCVLAVEQPDGDGAACRVFLEHVLNRAGLQDFSALDDDHAVSDFRHLGENV